MSKDPSFYLPMEKIKKIYKEEEKLKYSYNVFNALEIERKEVTLHSYFIYNLLNPYAHHGKSEIFLKNFLTEVLNYDEKELKKFNQNDYSFEKEVNAGKFGRIDFILKDFKKKTVYIIEMKIDAKDQPNQLKRYKDFGKIKFEKYKMFYLTLNGRKTKDKSIAENEYETISFEKNIVNWLKKSLKSLKEISPFKIAVKQYLQTVYNITDTIGDDKIREKYSSCLSKKNMNSAKKFIDECTSVRKKFLKNLNKEFAEYLKTNIHIESEISESYQEDYASFYQEDYIFVLAKNIQNIKNIWFGIFKEDKKLYFFAGTYALDKENNNLPYFDIEKINKPLYQKWFSKNNSLVKQDDLGYYYKHLSGFDEGEEEILCSKKNLNHLLNSAVNELEKLISYSAHENYKTKITLSANEKRALKNYKYAQKLSDFIEEYEKNPGD